MYVYICVLMLLVVIIMKGAPPRPTPTPCQPSQAIRVDRQAIYCRRPSSRRVHGRTHAQPRLGRGLDRWNLRRQRLLADVDSMSIITIIMIMIIIIIIITTTTTITTTITITTIIVLLLLQSLLSLLLLPSLELKAAGLARGRQEDRKSKPQGQNKQNNISANNRCISFQLAKCNRFRILAAPLIQKGDGP